MSDLRESFVRQRRNLNAASLALILVTAAGVSLQEIEILGNKFAVQRPSALSVAFWVAWVYFLVRYYQHWRDLADPEPAKAQEAALDRLLYKRGCRELTRIFEPSFPLPKDAPAPRFDVQPRGVIENNPGRVVVAYSGTANYQFSRDHLQQQSFEGYRVTLPALTRLDHLRAWLWVAMHTRHFTEYGLPVVLALSPVVILVGRTVSSVLAARMR